MGKIGIGITTHNRHQIFAKTLKELYAHTDLWGYDKLLNEGDVKWAFVDDASALQYMDHELINSEFPKGTMRYHRFDENVGIARAKNKCIELLDDCDHIFLFDDDIYPIVDNWWRPYIESGEPHLMYIFKDFATARRLDDTIELWRNDKIVAYSHARGPMLYIRRDVLDKVGGMNQIFGRWGYEHPEYSNRIFNAGLSSYRYADVIDSHKLFYSHDEHETVVTNVKGTERLAAIARNKELYNQRLYSTEYIPYKDKNNIVITTYFTGVADPQRKDPWKWDKDALNPLAESVSNLDHELIVLNDIKRIEHNVNATYIYTYATHNPYFQRWISIREYLRQYRNVIGKVFCVDATDVVMLKDPFPHMEHSKLYTGDEPEKVACPWIMNHHKHTKLQEFYRSHGNNVLLNAGLLGGDVDTVIDFLTQLIDFYFFAEIDTHYHKRPNCGMTDMATFNYIAYTKFADKISHGQHVNTKFKAYEQHNTTAWFSHK